jgi:hypothetical protein
MDDLAQKEAFGMALAMCPNDAFKAACAVFGDDTGSALRASQKWITDPVVLAAKLAYIETNGASHDLPTREEFAGEILAFARAKNEDGTKYLHENQFLAAFRLAGEVLGYVSKGAAVTVNNNNDNRTQNVMYVPQPTPDDDWADRLAAQQKTLTSVAAN